eukprot:1545964-Amphidinium_carterae.1
MFKQCVCVLHQRVIEYERGSLHRCGIVRRRMRGKQDPPAWYAATVALVHAPTSQHVTKPRDIFGDAQHDIGESIGDGGQRR